MPRPWLSLRTAVAASAAAAVLGALGCGGGGSATAPSPAPVSTCAHGYVGLTYDDGPSRTTPALLDALRRAGLRATMFDIGARAAEHPDLVRAEVRAGMWVQSHTLTHQHLTRLDPAALEREIAGAQEVLTRLTGHAPTLLRPPFLDTDPRVAAAIRQAGLVEVLLTVDSRDYAGASPDAIVAAAEQLRPGGILLMHDWPPATIAAVPGIAAVLARRGLCAGRIVGRSGSGGVRAVAVAP